MARTGYNSSTNSVMVVSNPLQVQELQTFTYAFWAKREDEISHNNNIYLFDLGSKQIYLDSSHYLCARVEKEPSYAENGVTYYSEVTSSYTLPLNEWVNISLTADFNNNEMHLYVSDTNGEWREVGDYIGIPGNIVSNSGDDLYFFGRTNIFPGSMAEIGVWNRVLSETELENLGIKRHTPTLISRGIRGAWRFESNLNDSVNGNNASIISGEFDESTHVPLILTSIPAGESGVTIYAPNLTAPLGQEIFNKGLISITWEIKDPPSSRSNITLADITYEIEYTENYVGRETIWETVRRRISGSDTSYDWYVGRMLKSDSVRMRVRSFCELLNKWSEYSPSNSNFSVNVFKLTPPAILSPVTERKYSDYITIILDEEQAVNTYNQKIRYKIEYQSENADVDWTVLFEDLPVGSSPLRWNVDGLLAADDYQMRLTTSDSDQNQFAVSYVRNIQIIHPGLFYIDTTPPFGLVEFEKSNRVTNELDQIVNLYVKDETTDVKSMALREGNATDLLTLGEIDDESKMFDPNQYRADCVEFKDEDNKDISPTGYTQKIKWRLKDISGLRKVEAKLFDYGDNDSCQKNNHLFLKLWKPNELITDVITAKETRDYLSLSESGSFATVSKSVNIAYLSTISGKMYSFETFPTLLYDIEHKISKLYRFVNNIYVFSYVTSSDSSRVYRDDRSTDLTLLTTFTDSLSEVTAVANYNDNLYFGMQNGQLWRFDGSSFSRLRTFDNPINYLLGDSRYLYIGFFSGINMFLYTGQTFVSLDVEV